LPPRRPLQFGAFLIPEAARHAEILEQAIAAERGGLELVGIQDHPYQRRFLDTWALIGHLLTRTSRLRCFPDVAALPLRPPAMMAKAAASLDVMSGGRFELGLGAGAFWEAIHAMGGPRRSPREAVEAFEEAVSILRLAWSGDRPVSFEGRHYSVHGYKPGPPPAHPIEIWVGASGSRMLHLTGRIADGWIPSARFFPPQRLFEAQRRIDDAAQQAGRDPATIRRLYNVTGVITDGRRGSEPLQGPIDRWVDTLATWATDFLVDTFIFWSEEPGTSQIDRFATEVVPGVRAALPN
jgi:alkanesulfonate monooxygenase SsuD/methylene tetrahydromethanopterin reductase-like flavin-dependent oxidoreductase (luciferase family)